MSRHLVEELLAVGAVGDDVDGEVEAGEGAEEGRDPPQLLAANAIAVLVLTVGARHPQFTGPDFLDAEGITTLG